MTTTTTDDNDVIMADDIGIGMGIGMDVDTDRNSAENSTTAATAVPKLQNNDHDVINVDDLLDKFGLIHTDAKLIAGKPTIVFFGGTGAGKTTTASFLAGATFELEFVGGFVHFKPAVSSNESLKKFKVCGGATSVTASIQTTEVVLKDVDGKRVTIIICDTPGFNDTKGPVMEISNGYGTIAAVQGASSIKPVVVINHQTMYGDRFASLREIVSNVIAMMGGGGSRSIDFSSFAYVFTHCDDRTKRHIATQISFFLKNIQNDPNMKSTAMFPTLVAMLTDMVSKTGPDDVICIDPEKPEEAPEILRKLWNGTRIENPADTFVNFCSKESMSALNLQINIMVDRIENSFGSKDFECAEMNLRKTVRLAEGLSLSEVDEAVKKGIVKAQQVIVALSTDIKNSLTHIEYQFEQTLNDTSSKLRLLAKSSGICDICEMDFDCDLFINNITKKLFAITREPIITLLGQAVPGNENIMQQSVIRFGSLLQSFHGIMGDDEIEKEYCNMMQTMEEYMTPILSVLNEQLNENDPTSTVLKDNLSNLNFLLTMNEFFQSSKFAALGLDSSRWTSFETELKNILDNIVDTVTNCVTRLADFDKKLQTELSGDEAWSYSSIYKLNGIDYYRECRNFLQVVSSSESLAASICHDASYNVTVIIRKFDDAVNKFVPNLISFLQGESSRTVFDNETGAMHDRVTEATNMNGHIDSLVVTVNVLKDLDCIEYQTMLDNLNYLNTKLTHFVEESKKEPVRRRPKLVPGKPLEPTEKELSETKNKRALRTWYRRYHELRMYEKKHGHCNASRNDPKTKSLGIWIMDQRKQGKKYEVDCTKSVMTREKIEHLEDLGFQWVSTAKKEKEDAIWNQRFEELKKYAEEHDGQLPSRHEPKLGRWVDSQKHHPHARTAHTAERKAKLRSISSGFHY